jgi:hypothetical protein
MSPSAAFGPATANTTTTDNALSGVSCTGWAHCLAVGSRATTATTAGSPLAEQWNGSTWQVVPMPAPAGLPGAQVSRVSCLSDTYCLAVGHARRSDGLGFTTLAESWNGSGWHVIQADDPVTARSAFLDDVSCGSLAGCIAVGGHSRRPGGVNALAELWVGGRWRVLRVRWPHDALASQLDGISCAGLRCMAVGLYENTSGQILTLAERWTGKAWRWQRPADPVAPITELGDIACPTANLCLAIGFSQLYRQEPVAELWQNGGWQLVPTVRLADAFLDGISCSTRTWWCIAVGSQGRQSLTEVWSGKRWQVLADPKTDAVKAGELSQVSCQAGPTRCISVGDQVESARPAREATFAQWWDGASWHVMTTINP